MANIYPNRKVGLVTFNNELSMIGDGKGEPSIVAGDKLFNYDTLLQNAQVEGEKKMKESISKSKDSL